MSSGLPIAAVIISAVVMVFVKIWDHYYNQSTRDLKDLAAIAKDLNSIESTPVGYKNYIEKMVLLEAQNFIEIKSKSERLSVKSKCFQIFYYVINYIGIISAFASVLLSILFVILWYSNFIGHENTLEGFPKTIIISFAIFIISYMGQSIVMNSLKDSNHVDSCSRKCKRNKKCKRGAEKHL